MEEKQNSAKDDLQIRVLHLTDRIPGYGTTRLLWDIVRLTPPQEVKHLVVTFFPDKGKFTYADRLRELGVYRQVPKPLFLKLVAHAVNCVTRVWRGPPRQ